MTTLLTRIQRIHHILANNGLVDTDRVIACLADAAAALAPSASERQQGGAEPRTSDQQLMAFYSVDSLHALIDMQERHVTRLQEKLAKHEKPFDFSPQRVREG